MLTFGSETPSAEPMPDFMLVDQPDALCAQLLEHDRIGVDTEFMREKTFFAELALLQIATRDRIFCVDPLSGSDMATFWKTVTDRTWVLHSARQDLEVVYQTAARMPASIFDTQIAAALLGFAPQIGYANLVKELFGIELAKSHTRADWSRRPLTDALLHYAAEDVEFLLPAYAALAEALDKKGRLSWAEEDSAELLDTSLYETDPQSAVMRLKGAKNLRGPKRSAAARLAAWRETEALRANRPRQWIARDAVLIELASQLPDTLDALQRIEGLPPGLIRRSGNTLLDEIASSRADNGSYRPPAAPNEAQKSLLKRMQKLTTECAADLGVAAETLAAKKDLARVVMNGDDSSRLLSGWRRRVIGEELLKLV
jgi:ribonuclease D